MRRYLILIVTLLALAGCAGNEAKKQTANTDPRVKVWMGNIRGDVPVLLWFTVGDDSTLYGRLWYTNYPQPPHINLIGDVKNGYQFTEIDTAGNITGYWNGQIKGDTLTGQWESPKSGKTMAFKVGIKDTVVDADPVFAAGDINGIYEYHLPRDGQGEINVKRLDNKRIVFNAVCIDPSPSHSQAVVDDDTAMIVNNMATYMSKDLENCGFTLSFYKNFMLVRYTNDASDCEFGAGATVSGAYMRTSANPAMGQKINK